MEKGANIFLGFYLSVLVSAKSGGDVTRTHRTYLPSVFTLAFFVSLSIFLGHDIILLSDASTVSIAGSLNICSGRPEEKVIKSMIENISLSAIARYSLFSNYATTTNHFKCPVVAQNDIWSAVDTTTVINDLPSKYM